MPTITKTSRLALAVAGLLTLGGLGVASAANLGISANNGLAAGASVTSSCQTSGTVGVAFNTPAYSSGTNTFSVNQVNLSNVSQACGGKSVKVVVTDTAGASLASYAGTVPTTANATQTISAVLDSSVNTANVNSVNVVFYG